MLCEGPGYVMEIKIVPEMFTVFDGRSENFDMLEPVRPYLS